MENPLDNNESLKRSIECPACLNYMKGKIYICLTGHSICHVCWNQLEQCPTCRDPLSHTRNFTMEAVVSFIKFSCENSEYGCKSTILMKEMTTHTETCSFRKYNCILGRGCKWTGRNGEIQKHAMDNHRRNVLMGEENIFFWKNHLPKNEVTMIVAYNEIFYFHKKTAGEHVYFVLQYVGKSEDADKFSYEVSITSDTQEQRKMSISEICQNDLVPLVSLVDTEKSVEFSQNKLETYSNRSGYTIYKLRVHKVVNEVCKAED